MRELISILLTIKSHPKHDSTVDMTIPVYLYNEKKPYIDLLLRLISHRSHRTDQLISHRARSNLANSPTADK
jgi:hypothetical protein